MAPALPDTWPSELLSEEASIWSHGTLVTHASTVIWWLMRARWKSGVVVRDIILRKRATIWMNKRHITLADSDGTKTLAHPDTTLCHWNSNWRSSHEPAVCFGHRQRWMINVVVKGWKYEDCSLPGRLTMDPATPKAATLRSCQWTSPGPWRSSNVWSALLRER